MKSNEIFPDCDEDYEAANVKCWEAADKQILDIESGGYRFFGDSRYFPLWTIFICIEKEA